MRFDKMMACVAVLGYTSAIKLETENALEAATQKGWDIGQGARDWINTEDSSNSRGLKGALEMCDRVNGKDMFERCDYLKRSVANLKEAHEYNTTWNYNVNMHFERLNDPVERQLWDDIV